MIMKKSFDYAALTHPSAAPAGGQPAVSRRHRVFVRSM